jgi:hypothetical protein
MYTFGAHVAICFDGCHDVPFACGRSRSCLAYVHMRSPSKSMWRCPGKCFLCLRCVRERARPYTSLFRARPPVPELPGEESRYSSTNIPPIRGEGNGDLNCQGASHVPRRLTDAGGCWASGLLRGAGNQGRRAKGSPHGFSGICVSSGESPGWDWAEDDRLGCPGNTGGLRGKISTQPRGPL